MKFIDPAHRVTVFLEEGSTLINTINQQHSIIILKFNQV